jgi:hypothetical protein
MGRSGLYVSPAFVSSHRSLDLWILRPRYSQKVLVEKWPADRSVRGRVLLVVRRTSMLPDSRSGDSLRAKGPLSNILGSQNWSSLLAESIYIQL